MYTSGVQSITQNKIPIKLPWTKQFGHKTISNQFFESFFLEQNWNKANYIGKKSNVKTESTQQAREIWQVLDSEYATIEAN